jgi:hypothetical protein
MNYNVFKMNNLFIILLIFISIKPATAQNCFVEIYNNTGYTILENSIEGMSCEIRTMIPVSHRDSFMIFVAGLYYMTRYISEGNNLLLNELETLAANESKYYILYAVIFSKESSAPLRIKISTNLPHVAPFDCLNSSNHALMGNQIEVNTGLHNNPDEYLNHALENTISLFNEIYNENCCIVASDNIPVILRELGFLAYPIQVQSISTFQSGELKKRQAGVTLNDKANLNITLDEETFDIGSTYFSEEWEPEESFDIFITKNSNICETNDFKDIEDDYNDIGLEHKIWFHIYEQQNPYESDSLYINWGSSEIDFFGLNYLRYYREGLPLELEQPGENKIVEVDVDGYYKRLQNSYINKAGIRVAGYNEIYVFNDQPHDKRMSYIGELKNFILYEDESTPSDIPCMPAPLCIFYDILKIDSVYTSKEISWLPWGARHLYASIYSPQDEVNFEGNKLDFTASTLHLQYRILGCDGFSDALKKEEISHFYIRPDVDLMMAFNMFDFGNYFWGGAMRILGFSERSALYWANWNERKSDRGGDSPADQRAIKWGYKTSKGIFD